MALIYEEESYQILGACFEVYREVGCGFLEPIYQECLELEFELQNIPFQPQPELRPAYKGRTLQQVYKPDFICFDKIVVEIKAVSELTNIFRAKLRNYLKLSHMRLGFLVNFGHHPKLEHERVIY